jgi:hypothetical protein
MHNAQFPESDTIAITPISYKFLTGSWPKKLLGDIHLVVTTKGLGIGNLQTTMSWVKSED